MTEHTLPHKLAGERQRLALMSSLLDPMEQTYLDTLGVGHGWRCLELGCGNGSIARALATRVAPSGHVVASDIDLTYLGNLEMPCLEVRRVDVLRDELETGFYDLVVARALLHHLTPASKALERMVDALKPGGVLLSVEPDMMPCTVTERFNAQVLARVAELVGSSQHRLLHRTKSSSLAGLTWVARHCRGRTHCMVQWRVRLGELLGIDHPRTRACTSQIDVCH